MRSLLPLILGPALLAAASAGAQVIGVPSPGNSTTPACMALCPMGDLSFTVVVRDLANDPLAGSTVVLDFSQCPGAFLCTSPHPDPYVIDPVARRLSANTNGAGSVTFPARVGGTGGPGSVRVFADGVFLRSYALASPDQDANGVVLSFLGSQDDPLFAARLGTTDPTADFDCDGDVDDADQQIFFSHHSHSCDGWVDPARQGSWGRLKTHYR